MQMNIPPDLEKLINKRISSGGYADAEDVLRRALEVLDAEESWTNEERQALSAHIEEGYLQAERGELTDGEQARGEMSTRADRVEQAIYDACAFVAEAPVRGHSRSDLSAGSLCASGRLLDIRIMPLL